MIPFLIWFLGAMAVAAASSYWSMKVNEGSIKGLWGVIGVGFITSLLWAYCSKVSTNLLRDSLIWDVMYVVTFSITLVYLGYGSKYELKHWVGIVMLMITFIYWLLVENKFI